jgi:hypothetical protein
MLTSLEIHKDLGLDSNVENIIHLITINMKPDQAQAFEKRLLLINTREEKRDFRLTALLLADFIFNEPYTGLCIRTKGNSRAFDMAEFMAKLINRAHSGRRVQKSEWLNVFYNSHDVCLLMSDEDIRYAVYVMTAFADDMAKNGTTYLQILFEKNLMNVTHVSNKLLELIAEAPVMTNGIMNPDLLPQRLRA